MCIIDNYPLGNQRTEISGGLNISEKLRVVQYVFNVFYSEL